MGRTRAASCGKTRGRWALPALCYAAGIAGLSVTITRPILVRIAETYQITVALAGQLMTAAAVLGLVGMLVVSPFLDRVRRRDAILVTLGVMAVAGLGCAAAPSFLLLCVTYAPAGLGAFILFALVMAATGDLKPGPLLAPALGWISVGNIGVSMVGLPILGALAERAGWRVAFVGYALLASVAFVAIALSLPRGEQPTPARGIQYAAVFRHLFRAGSLSSVLWTVAAVCACVYGSSTFLGALAEQRLGLSTGQTGTLLGVFMAGSALAGFSTGRVVRAPRPGHVAGAAMFAGVIALLLYTTAYSLPWFTVLGFLNSFSTGASTVLVVTLLLERAGEERGMVSGLRSLMECVGAIAGPALAGAMVSRSGYPAAGVSFAVVAFMGAALVLLVHKREAAARPVEVPQSG